MAPDPGSRGRMMVGLGSLGLVLLFKAQLLSAPEQQRHPTVSTAPAAPAPTRAPGAATERVASARGDDQTGGELSDFFDEPGGGAPAATAVSGTMRAAHASESLGWRSWNLSARYDLKIDAEPIVYAPPQLFAPTAPALRQMQDDLTRGCLVGRGPPTVLRVTPRILAVPHRMGMRAFNPSIVQRGHGYLVSYRVDSQHGCSVVRKGMLQQHLARAGRRHTALVRTDEALRPLGAARVLDACGRAIALDSAVDLDAGTAIVDVRLSRAPRPTSSAEAAAAAAAAAAGATGRAPPVRDAIWLTYLPIGARAPAACKACCLACDKSAHVARLRVHATAAARTPPRDRSADDGDGWSVSLREQTPLCTGVLGGRNHALLFADGAEPRTLVQSWLHPRVVVGSLPTASERAAGAPAPSVRTSEAPSLIALRGGDAAALACRHLRISGTSPMLRLAPAGGRPGGWLGVGHLHHVPAPNRSHGTRREGLEPVRKGVAYFGSYYMHFWYLLGAEPPHALLAHSSEWCLPSAADGARCEVVQFVSGLEFARGGRRELLLAFGVNDCESKWARLPLADALAALEWVER